jgi:hypothetical protein
MRSIGSGSPITPVDMTSTSVGTISSIAAVASAIRAACALAVGGADVGVARVDDHGPRGVPSAACRSVIRQDGALTRLVVVSAATDAGPSATTSARSGVPRP